jgi:hypothetical protein
MTRTVTLAGYAVLAAAVSGYQLAGWRWRRTPTLSQAWDAVSRWRGVRWLILGAWLWLGWHLFVRGSR